MSFYGFLLFSQIHVAKIFLFIPEKYSYSLPLKIFHDVCLSFYFLDQNLASHLCIFRENPGLEMYFWQKLNS